MSRARGQKNRGKAKKLLHRETNAIMSASAQFRTCLWPRVGWWASGQEAGQPPGANAEKFFGRLSSEPLNRQPEAKPAHPALNGGRGLKQRRNGLLWSRRPSKGRHRRGLSILPAVRSGFFPLQAKAASRVQARCFVRVSTARQSADPHPLTPGEFAFAQISMRAARLIEPGEESAHDRAHPRFPA